MPAFSIIAAEFNKPLIDAMVAVAEEELQANGMALARVVRVPGCYELPMVADAELAKPDVGGLVVLGYIERGETRHGEVMGNVVMAALIRLQLHYKKPMGLGIIGPGATPEQAKSRHIDYAKSAVAALKRVVDALGG